MKPLTEALLIAATNCTQATARQWLDPINASIARFSLSATVNRLAMFLAQTGHESAGFTRLVENMNYSAQGMAATWPTRFAVTEAGRYVRQADGRHMPNPKALALHRNPEAIANNVYASRMGNGPIASGNGWDYRGRGPIQLSGLEMYIACGRGIGLDLALQPHLLEQPKWGALSAGWYWSQRSLNGPADNGNVEQCTRIINGGLIGLADRLRRFTLAQSVLSAHDLYGSSE